MLGCPPTSEGKASSRNLRPSPAQPERIQYTRRPAAEGTWDETHAGTLHEDLGQQPFTLKVELRRHTTDWVSALAVGPCRASPTTTSSSTPTATGAGPTWVSTNWLAIEGLHTHDLYNDADRLTLSTLDLIGRAGFYEYVNPVTGHGRGSPDFSWTAGLVINLLSASAAVRR